MTFLENIQEDLITREAYTYFKKNKLFNDITTDDFFKWSGVVKGLIKSMEVLNYNSRCGIYLRGVGYFASVPLSVRQGERISLVRRRPEKIEYIRKFFPDDPKMEGWLLDEVFKSTEVYNLKLTEVEFYKNQTRDADYINKRNYRRSRS